MSAMSKTKLIWTVGVLGGVILLGLAWQRGVIRFSPGSWQPQFSLAAITNPVPSLNRPTKIPENFPQEARPVYETNLAQLKDTLGKDPTNITAWLDLAIYYRMVGDNEGAVQIWKYISAKHPDNGVALHNIGEYYFHTVRDYPTAESYYRRAIAVAPEMSANYSDLFEMYQSDYKQEGTAATDIMREGISKVQTASSLSLLLTFGEYQAKKGDTAGARESFNRARDIAKSLGNEALVQEIDAQLASLK